MPQTPPSVDGFHRTYSCDHVLVFQGACEGPPSPALVRQWNLTGPGLLEWKQGQCVIICDADCLGVKSTELWMHNLYWRFKRSNRSDDTTSGEENALVRVQPCMYLHIRTGGALMPQCGCGSEFTAAESNCD